MGCFPLIFFIMSITGVTSSGSPGPFERKIPSGFMNSISSAEVSKGTMVTLQPNLLRQRIMLSLMPQSTATTLNFGFEVREYQRFLQLTFSTASWGTAVSLMILRPSSREVETSVMSTRLEPLSRILLVSFLVSTPEMPGMLFSSRSSERVFVYLKLEGISL